MNFVVKNVLLNKRVQPRNEGKMYCPGIKNFKAWKKRNKKLADKDYCDKVCKKKCNKVGAINFIN